MPTPLRLLSPFFAFALAASPQTSSPSLPSGSTAAEQVALKSIAAFSPGPVRSVHLAGTAHAIAGSTKESGSFDFTLDQSGEASFRLDAGTLTRTETSSQFSKIPSCTWTGADGVQHPVAEHNCMLSVHWLVPLLGLQAHFSELTAELPKGEDAEVPGLSIEHRGPKASSKTQETLEKLSQVSLRLEPASGLPQSLHFNVHPDDNGSIDIPIEVRYSDYRNVSGAMIAFHIEKFLNNSKILELQAETAEVTR